METPTGIYRIAVKDTDSLCISTLSSHKKDNTNDIGVDINTTVIDNFCTGEWVTCQLPNGNYIICKSFILKDIITVCDFEDFSENMVLPTDEEDVNRLKKLYSNLKSKNDISVKFLNSYDYDTIKDTETKSVIVSLKKDFVGNKEEKHIDSVFSGNPFLQRITNTDDGVYFFDTDWDAKTNIEFIIGASESVCGIFISMKEEERTNDSISKLFEMLSKGEKGDQVEN